MENGAFEKKWEVFFFLVILFLVSFILVRAGLQRIRESAPSTDNLSLLARLAEERTFLKNQSSLLPGDDETGESQDETINEEVVRQFNEQKLDVSERIVKSVVSSPVLSKSAVNNDDTINDIVVFPEAMRFPPVKDKRITERIAAEQSRSTSESTHRMMSGPQDNATQPAVSVAIPFARQWEARKTLEDHASMVSVSPETEPYNNILHSEDMSSQVPVSPKPVKVVANKPDSSSTTNSSAMISTDKTNPFRNVSLEKDVTPDVKANTGKTDSAKPTITLPAKNLAKTEVAKTTSTKATDKTAATNAAKISNNTNTDKKTTSKPKTENQHATDVKPATVKNDMPSVQVRTATGTTAETTVPVATQATVQHCDEVWLVSNPCSQPVCPESLSWRRLDGRQFVTSSYTAYQSNTVAMPTVVFIHGNLTNMVSAVESGMYLKSRMESIRLRLGIKSAFRLVIWKWNSEKTYIAIRKDSQYKAALADEDGRSLAAFLKNDTSGRTTLIGFSFGAKIIGSACNVLVCNDHKNYQAIFVSAATDYYDYSSNGIYAPGAKCLDLLLNLYNPKDKVLRFYPLLYGRGGVPALGTMPFTSKTISPGLSGKTMSLSSACCGSQHKFGAFMQCIPDQTLAEIVFGK